MPSRLTISSSCLDSFHADHAFPFPTHSSLCCTPAQWERALQRNAEKIRGRESSRWCLQPPHYCWPVLNSINLPPSRRRGAALTSILLRLYLHALSCHGTHLILPKSLPAHPAMFHQTYLSLKTSSLLRQLRAISSSHQLAALISRYPVLTATIS